MGPAPHFLLSTFYFLFANFDFCRAAAFLWISPFRAARSRSCVAFRRSTGDDSVVPAVFIAVRSAARCARLRTVAARVLRMFFFADAILGTDVTLSRWLVMDLPVRADPRALSRRILGANAA